LPHLKIRRATLRDIELLVAHRRGMWRDMGYKNKKPLDAADPVYRRWAKERLKNGELVGWIIEVSQKPVASGCVWLQPVQPRPGFNGGGSTYAHHPEQKSRGGQPYLLSMYTEPKFRGQGLAKKIVLESLRWAKKEGFSRMTLHASDMGKGIYEKLKFERTWEMKLDLKPKRR